MPFLEVDGARLHYETAGQDGPAIVLVHGGLCHLEDWQPVMAELARDCTVLAPDLRAHGLSGGEAGECSIARWAMDLVAMTEALGCSPAVLVGHSMASRVVAEAALLRPDLAAGVVLFDGSRSHGGFARAAPDIPDATPPMQRPLAEVLNLTIGPFLGDTARAAIIATMSAAPPALMARTVEAMREWDSERADAVFALLPDGLPVMAVQSTYHDAQTPRRCLTGADRTTPYLDFLTAVCPSIRNCILSDTGHFIMLEKPEVAAGLIRDFARDAAR